MTAWAMGCGSRGSGGFSGATRSGGQNRAVRCGGRTTRCDCRTTRCDCRTTRCDSRTMQCDGRTTGAARCGDWVTQGDGRTGADVMNGKRQQCYGWLGNNIGMMWDWVSFNGTLGIG
ncbi:hypothetical protein Pcinc_020719 [Petrolisthes cinctipes]|uniref:Uncharacterized protein n=1 Tax=Petrolisthes cinctipes TaxID=88211 RepID=A0AAE1FIX5_PETCI|nr:hypothetical protein Pcinc_020719 [Petrolisthes cinctipes]